MAVARKIPADTTCFHFVNANPEDKRTGDCIMRAVCTATSLTWDEVVDGLCEISHRKHIAPQDPAAERELLKVLGFKQQKQPKRLNGKKITGRDFCRWLEQLVAEGALPARTPVVANIGTHHVVAVMPCADGRYRICDTWDCSTRCVGTWWTA